MDRIVPTPDLSPSALLSHLISVRLSLLERLLGHRFDIAWRQEPCQSEDAHAVFHGDTLLRLLSSVYGHDQCHRICRGIVRSGSKPAISDPLLISLNEENILKFTLSENGKLTGRSAPVTSECSAEDLSSRSNVAQLLRAVPPEGEVDGSSPCGGSRSEVNDGADISADKPSTDTPRRQLPIALTIGRSALSLRFRRQQTPEITHQEARNLRKKSKSVSTLRTSEAVGKFGRKPLAAIEKGEGKRPLQKSNRSTEKKMSQETSLTDSGQGDSACLGGTGRGRQLQGSHLPLINTSTSSKCYRLKSGKKASLRGRGESFKLPLIDGSDCCLRECDGPPSSSTCPPSGVHNCTRKTSLEMLIEDALSRDISGQIGRYRVTKFKDTGESMRDEHTELSSAEQSSDYLIDMRSMQQLPTEPQMYGTERATAGPVDTSHLSQQTSNSEQSLADSQQPMELSAHENVYENTDPQMCGRSKVGNLIDTLRVASSLVGETSRKSQLSDTSGEVNKATSAADSDRTIHSTQKSHQQQSLQSHDVDGNTHRLELWATQPRSPKYFNVNLLMVPFVDVPWHPAHVTKVVPSTITICGITELIKTETDAASDSISVFKNGPLVDCHPLPPDVTLQDLGYRGSESPLYAAKLTLYYDCCCPITHCPILMADSMLSNQQLSKSAVTDPSPSPLFS